MKMDKGKSDNFRGNKIKAQKLNIKTFAGSIAAELLVLYFDQCKLTN